MSVRSSRLLVPAVERIAVLRGNALGDLVVALPALEALRAAYPEAHVALLGREHHRAILRTRPSPVDEVVVLPDGVIGDEAVPLDLSARSRVVGEIAGRRWDLAVQLHGGGGNSNAFIAALDARVTAGSRADGAPSLDRWIPYEHYQPEIARYLEVVALVGAAPVAIEPRLAVVDADRAARARELPELAAGGRDPAPYVVLHPGATDPRRRWPAALFAEVGRALLDAGRWIVVTGVPAEQPLVDELADRIGRRDRLVRATGLSLAGLLGLLADADLIVSNDTGPLHLAVAVDTPTVGIFWIGNLINAGPFTRRRHRPLIAWRTTCPVCGAPTTGPRCEHDVSFVDEVSSEAAISAARALLGPGNAPADHAPARTRVASGP